MSDSCPFSQWAGMTTCTNTTLIRSTAGSIRLPERLDTSTSEKSITQTLVNLPGTQKIASQRDSIATQAACIILELLPPHCVSLCFQKKMRGWMVGCLRPFRNFFKSTIPPTAHLPSDTEYHCRPNPHATLKKWLSSPAPRDHAPSISPRKESNDL